MVNARTTTSKLNIQALLCGSCKFEVMPSGISKHQVKVVVECKVYDILPESILQILKICHFSKVYPALTGVTPTDNVPTRKPSGFVQKMYYPMQSAA